MARFRLASLSWFSGKLSRKRDVGAKVELTPLLKALLLEFEESENDRLVNLSSNEATGDAFLYFLGDGRIFPPWEVVSADPELGLESEAASTIQQERERYERWVHHGRDDGERTEIEGSDSTTMLSRPLVWIGSTPASSCGCLWRVGGGQHARAFRPNPTLRRAGTTPTCGR